MKNLPKPEKLYSWPTSPFGAKVKACLKALDLYDTVEIVCYHPWQVDQELRELNPLGKIPVLILDDDTSVYDSPVICEYLNEYAQGNLIPSSQKFTILRIQALCDGILDAGVSGRYESHMRPLPLRSQDWLSRQMTAIEEGFKSLSKESFPQDINLATICVVVTLAYIQLRYPEFYDAKTPSMLKEYLQIFENHPVFESTKPKDSMPLPQNITTIER